MTDDLPHFKGQPSVDCPTHGVQPSPSFQGFGGTLTIRANCQSFCPICKARLMITPGVYHT